MLVNKENYAARWRVRQDGEDKVKGALSYLTDLTAPEMLFGKVLRSMHPHALILTVDISKAKALPGVLAVLTHEDVPGLNGFGLVVPDQPVFCKERVLYEGDAVAAVAAETEAIAERALELIEVLYEPLPIVGDPEEALRPESPLVQAGGNVAASTRYEDGDPEAAFAHCAYVVETTYYTPRQMHTYMEMEGGLFVPEADGSGLTVYSATQHSFKDRMQLSRILSIPEERIRVVSSPIGGSFGGKDELNVQPYGALLALATGRPVKMHNSRWESVRAGLKRHPMKITMKTGVASDGRLLAHTARIIADKGPYSTLGPAVLTFATEHASGPYRIPNVKIEGTSVFTNNGMSGEFRGFGGNQVIFAVEGQMDRLAKCLGMDPWKFRRLNLRRAEDKGPTGHTILATKGAEQVWEAMERSAIWAGRNAEGSLDPEEPWVRRGVGAAIVMHGFGFGYGLLDPAGGRLRLTMDGKLEAAFGFEEFGQGLIPAVYLMMEDVFGCTETDITVVIGDTARVPHTGSSTASRTTTMIWMALTRMREEFTSKLLGEAAAVLQMSALALRLGPGGIWNEDACVLSYSELARKSQAEIRSESRFDFPVTPDAVFGGHYLHSYAAVAAEVEVNLLTGRVKLLRTDHAIAAGPVVNPMGYVGQIEGGAGMALGFALTEDAVMEEGVYLTKNLDSYLIPTIRDVPLEVQVEAIEELPEGDLYGPRGIGEIGSIGLAPAIAAAIHQAVGVWVERLPVRPEQLLDGTTGMRPFDLKKTEHAS
ncbi:xanthine dehydrogenase subunit D [Paenibacillus turpanensis]|uniref:xanthine dehydrogenase subunit D n=1 Tax=Paenibacillus turpanensis TaxID=2689078 RepID=UPI00140A3715|nr:xanthine dehydrogenase subunit D [Paenibacillus turpanensis]